MSICSFLLKPFSQLVVRSCVSQKRRLESHAWSLSGCLLLLSKRDTCIMLLNSTCSIIMHEVDVKEISLYYAGLDLFPFLKTGGRVAVFQSDGRVRVGKTWSCLV